jgi:hypothetical protein
MHKNEKGQTLVIIFFVMLLALIIGVGISDRFITALRSLTRTTLNYRAYAVAEAAVENILLRSTTELEDFINFNSCGSDCYLEITNADGIVETAVITLSFLGNSSEPFGINLHKDSVSEVSLAHYGNSKNITVCWDSPVGTLPAVTGTLVYKPTASTFSLNAFSYNSVGSLYNNGFPTSAAAHGYQNCFTVNSLQDPQILRLRAVYTDVEAVIIPDSSATLPSQGILIESVGTVLDTSRKITVIKTNSVVPLPFDFVIFNKSTTDPLAN